MLLDIEELDKIFKTHKLNTANELQKLTDQLQIGNQKLIPIQFYAMNFNLILSYD